MSSFFSSLFSVFSSSSSHARVSAVKTLVEDSIVQHKVVIFSKSYCPYCKRAKALFSSNYPNLETKVYELDQLPDGSAIQDYLEEKTGQRTVPNIFVNQVHIGGSSDADTKHASGELSRLAT
ncbi:hypothetical protein ONZ45_g15173 [Pleurotus djamor]|nr:hypothetical protein ONZ45_g15173 [Pleurotus djamor]